MDILNPTAAGLIGISAHTGFLFPFMTQFLVILKEPKTYLVIKEDELRKIEEERNIQMLERINSLKIHA